MKKTIYIILSILCFGMSVHAQEDSSKVKVEPTTLKPKAGDIAIGIDALPYIKFLGNVFGKTSTNALALTEQTLYGKYFLTNTTAIRMSLSSSLSTTNDYAYTNDDAASLIDPLSTEQVTDLQNTKINDFGFSLGYEMRKDKGRFALVYGAQMQYAYSRSQTTYTYGNPISEINQSPSSAYAFGSIRTLSYDGGITNSIGLGGFVGLEYFVAKKISIGADFTLNYMYSFGSQSDKTQEEWDGNSVYEYTTPSDPGDTSSSLSTSQYGSLYAGQIYVNFYF